jgi:type 1 fimbria pilin
MDLDAIPGRATGYGIQLAWGDSTTQSEPPAKPVNFNTRMKASELNSNFYQADHSGRLPGNRALPVGADSTIALSARYVRIPGATVSAGQANGKIEVLASYE